MVRLTDRPDMTLDVYRGRKTTMQQSNNKHLFKLDDNQDTHELEIWLYCTFRLGIPGPEYLNSPYLTFALDDDFIFLPIQHYTC